MKLVDCDAEAHTDSPLCRALHPGDQLWVEKHKPTCVAQLVGNGKLVADLRAWLAQWHRCAQSWHAARMWPDLRLAD